MASKGLVKDEKGYADPLDKVKEALDFVNRKPDEPKLDEKKESKNQPEEKQIEELTDTLKRLQAEFENYKKRVDKEKIEFVKYAHADVVAQMLSVLDSFEIALKNTNDKEKFVEGIKIIFAQFHSVL